MAASFSSARERMAGRLAQRLQKVSHPRAQMALIVSATGSSCFSLGLLMLKARLDRMAPRYARALGRAYLAFPPRIPV